MVYNKLMFIEHHFCLKGYDLNRNAKFNFIEKNRKTNPTSRLPPPPKNKKQKKKKTKKQNKQNQNLGFKNITAVAETREDK